MTMLTGILRMWFHENVVRDGSFATYLNQRFMLTTNLFDSQPLLEMIRSYDGRRMEMLDPGLLRRSGL